MDFTLQWQPTAAISLLKRRAAILAKIRHFFTTRGLLEVETPLLSAAAVTDPYLQSFSTHYTGPHAGQHGQLLYLQTSPEFAMKRLLAAGSGPIFQICKAFRNDELGRYHNPEFTMLEWYRPGFGQHALMQEVNELLQLILDCPSADKLSYEAVFLDHTGLNPHTSSVDNLQNYAQSVGITTSHLQLKDKDSWLHLLMSHCIEPHLGLTKPCFIYDYPASQAALAQIRPDQPPVAERFEVYFKGIELANGFHELADAKEQAQRFAADLEKRRTLGLPTITVDQHLLAALDADFPDCSGVALGIDRLIMLACQTDTLQEVISFTIDRA